MPRVKKGKRATQKREKLLRKTKGFSWGRKTKKRAAKEALLHAEARAYRGRKEKKRTMRSLWIVRLNAALRKEGMTYRAFIDALNKKKIALDRKVLSEIAAKHPEVFRKIVEAVK